MADGSPPDDHTIDADPGELDRIRRLARRAQHPVVGPLDERTIDADDSTLERLRRLAQHPVGAPLESGAGVADSAHVPDRRGFPPPQHDLTVDADESTFERLRAATRADEQAPARSADRPPRDLSAFDVPDLAQLSQRRPPPTTEAAEPWRPPARSVLPTARQEPGPAHAHPLWRWATIGLAVVVVALVGWLVLGDDGAGDAPEGPVVTGPEPGVITTGVVGEGGSGG